MADQRSKKLKVERDMVELVKAKPALYLKSHPGHSDAVIVANSWKKIFEQLGENDVVTSAESCEKLWSNIWSQYLAFKRKLKGKTGQAGDKRPYFRLKEAMREFDDKLHVENNYCNDDDDSEGEDSSPILNTIAQEDGVITVLEVPVVRVPDETPVVSAIGDEPSSSISPKPRSHDASKKRKDREFEDELLKIMKTRTDEFKVFGVAIAMKLRKLDPQVALDLQFEIHQLLYNASKVSK